MRARMLLLPAALAALMAFCGVAQARDVNCAELPAAVESAGAEPETVVLDEMCTKADVGGSAIAVKSGANLTLRGLTPRTFAGLDGVQIASVGAASVTLEDLTFENADHGGVHLRGVGHVRLADDAFVEDGTLESAGGGLSATTA